MQIRSKPGRQDEDKNEKDNKNKDESKDEKQNGNESRIGTTIKTRKLDRNYNENNKTE